MIDDDWKLVKLAISAIFYVLLERTSACFEGLYRWYGFCLTSKPHLEILICIIVDLTLSLKFYNLDDYSDGLLDMSHFTSS